MRCLDVHGLLLVVGLGGDCGWGRAALVELGPVSRWYSFTYTCIHLHVSRHTRTCSGLCVMYAYACALLHACRYMCMHTCIHARMCTYMCVCNIYIYIDIYL